MSTGASVEGVNSTSTLMDEARVEELLSEKLMDGFLLMERACPRCITPLVKQEGKTLDDNKNKRNKDMNTPIQGVPFCVSCKAHIMHDETDIMRLQRHYHGQALQGRILIDFQKDPDKRNRSLIDDDETVATQTSSVYTPSPSSASAGSKEDSKLDKKKRPPSVQVINPNGEPEIAQVTSGLGSNKSNHTPQIDFMDPDEVELICSRSLAENTSQSSDAGNNNPVQNVMIDAISGAQLEVASVVESFDKELKVAEGGNRGGARSIQSSHSQQSKVIVKARTAATEDSPMTEYDESPRDISKTIVKAPSISGSTNRGSESPHDHYWPSFAERKMIATKVLSVKMLQGYKLMQKQCRRCSMPLTDLKGQVSCAVCPILERRASQARDAQTQANQKSARLQDDQEMQQNKIFVQKKRNQFLEKAKIISVVPVVAGAENSAGFEESALQSTERQHSPFASVDNKNGVQPSQRPNLVVKTNGLLSPEREKPNYQPDDNDKAFSKTNTAVIMGKKIGPVGNEPNLAVYSIPVVNVASPNKKRSPDTLPGTPNENAAPDTNNPKPTTDRAEDGTTIQTENKTMLDKSVPVTDTPLKVDNGETIQPSVARTTSKTPNESEAMESSEITKETSKPLEPEEGNKEEAPTASENYKPDTPVSSNNASVVASSIGLSSPTEAAKANVKLPTNNTLVRRSIPAATANTLLCSTSINDETVGVKKALPSPESGRASLLSQASSRPSEASKFMMMSARTLKISKPYLKRSFDLKKDPMAKKVPEKGKSVRPVMGIEKVTPQTLSKIEESSSPKSPNPKSPAENISPAVQTPNESEAPTASGDAGPETPSENTKLSSMHSDSTISTKTKIFFKDTGYEAFHGRKLTKNENGSPTIPAAPSDEEGGMSGTGVETTISFHERNKTAVAAVLERVEEVSQNSEESSDAFSEQKMDDPEDLSLESSSSSGSSSDSDSNSVLTAASEQAATPNIPVSRPKSTFGDFESRRKIASKEIGNRMAKGWILLNSACATCATPLMTDSGGELEVCVFCNVTRNIKENENISQAPTTDFTATSSKKREAIDPGSPLSHQEVDAFDQDAVPAPSISQGFYSQHLEESRVSDSSLNSGLLPRPSIVVKESQGDPPAVQGHTLRRREAQDCEPETHDTRPASGASPIALLKNRVTTREQEPSELKQVIRRRDPEDSTTMRAPDPKDLTENTVDGDSSAEESSSSKSVTRVSDNEEHLTNNGNVAVEEREVPLTHDESDSDAEELPQILKDLEKMDLQLIVEQSSEEEKKESETDESANGDVFTLAIPAGFDVNNEVALRQLIAAAKYGIPLKVDTDHNEEHRHAQREASPGMSAVSPPGSYPGIASSETTQPSTTYRFSPESKIKSRITPESMGRSRQRKSNRVVSPQKKGTGFTPEQAYQVLSPITAANDESVHSDSHSEVISVQEEGSVHTENDERRILKSDPVSIHPFEETESHSGVEITPRSGISHSLNEEKGVHSEVAGNPTASSESHASGLAPALSHGKTLDGGSSSQAASHDDFMSGLSSLSNGFSHLSNGLPLKTESGISHKFPGSGSSVASPISIHGNRKSTRQQYRIHRNEISSSEPETIVILDDVEEEEDQEDEKESDKKERQPDENETTKIETVLSHDDPASVASEHIDALLARIEETQAQLAAAGEEEDSMEKRQKLAELLDRLSAAAAAVEELDDSYSTNTEEQSM